MPTVIRKSGVFTSQMLQTAVGEGHIRLPADVAPSIQPSSLDLTLGDTAYRVRASFLPGKGCSVEERLADGLLMHKLDLTDGAVLEKGCVYLVKLRESLALPEGVSASANPKSSTGRIDVFVRTVTDGAMAFEKVPTGYEGVLYAEIYPRTFSVMVRTGSSLNQLRLRYGHATVEDKDLHALHDTMPIVSGTGHFENGLCMTVNLAGGADKVVGYRARHHSGLIDVDAPETLDPREYWEPIFEPKNGKIILDPDEFYILASKEALRVPRDMAGEMVPIDPLLGEFRVHYAGFFDPGFGDTNGTLNGARAVLEVRGRDAPFMIEDGQLVARLVYEPLCGTSGMVYGTSIASNYQGQGLRLSKHFRAWA